MTKLVRRRKNGMVGTYSSTNENTNDDRVTTHQIEQYPERNFHFRRSFDDCCDAVIMGEKKDEGHLLGDEKEGHFQDQMDDGSMSSGRVRALTFPYEGEFLAFSSPVKESFPTGFPNGDTSFPTSDKKFPNGYTSFPTEESRIKDTDYKNITTNRSKTLEAPTIFVNDIDLSTNHTEDKILNINAEKPAGNDSLSSSPGMKQCKDFIGNDFSPNEPSSQQMDSNNKLRNIDPVSNLDLQQNSEHNFTHQDHENNKKPFQEKYPSINNLNQQHLQNSRIYQLRNTDNPGSRNRTRSSEGLEIGDTNNNNEKKRSSFLMKLRKTFSFDNIDLKSVFGNNKPSLNVQQQEEEDNQQLSIHQNHLMKRRRSFSTSDIEKTGEGGRVCSLHKLPFSYEVW